jgi:Zn-finger nucleic acid-binding protein
MNHCPRDRQILASNDVSGYRYYSCEQCHGFWIPGAALERVLSAKGITELRALPRGGPSEIRCPDCRTNCDSLLIERCRVDPCPRCHGVWLDSGEVRHLKRLFPEGSAVVIADAERPSMETQQALVAWSITDEVGNLLMLVLR